MDKFYEKTISTETVYSGRVFDITKSKIQLSNGMEGEREIIRHPGGVVVVAVKGSKLLMVKQFRYAVGSLQQELPAGRLEYGENPLEAAKRELREETGYLAENWESLGYIFTSFGICNERLYLFKAENLTYDKPDPDEGEILDCFEVELDEVYNLIKNGTINDAKTICALMRAFKL